MKDYIECQVCGSCININTNGVYTPCACGAIAVDGNNYYTRVIGGFQYWKQYKDGKEVKED